MRQERIAVIGLGYVGLPIAVALSRCYERVVGFDISARRLNELREGHDSTHEIEPVALKESGIVLTSDPADLSEATVFIVTVPTPIDANKQPDLGPVISASETVGAALRPGALVVYESTVYPGVTEEICRPILAQKSGLEPGEQFKVAYSPERINPGDKEHTIDKIVKVVSGEDDEALERASDIYRRIVKAGVYEAPRIRVAEAAKVIENIQRDLNVALMNEFAMIFDRMEIRTKDVLAAAATKWNFLPFRPGLVGGHCIGVDPYYLTSKAQSLGYHPEVILSGRRINDDMGAFLAQKLAQLLTKIDKMSRKARVAVLGLTFKENVPDLRNSRVPDIVQALRRLGIECLVHDPYACPASAEAEHGVRLCAEEDLTRLDGLVVAVAHRPYIEAGAKRLSAMLNKPACVMDVKSIFDAEQFEAGIAYWSL